MKKPRKTQSGKAESTTTSSRANGPEELVMGWHCYLDDEIQFPFQATCIAPKIISPLRKGRLSKSSVSRPGSSPPTCSY